MRFNNGMFGACLVVVTLLATVLAGFVLSIEREEVPVKSYEYVTDISGLFDYSDAPEYVTYNPSTNYTGYSSTNTISQPVYTESSTTNPYRFIKEPGTTSTYSASLDSSVWFSSHIDGEPSDGGVYKYRAGLWNGSTYNFGSPQTVQIPPGNLRDNYNWVADNVNDSTPRPNIVTLTKVLNKWVSDNHLSNYATLEIDLSYSNTAPVLFYGGDWQTGIMYVGVPATQINYKTAILNENNSMPTHLSVNLNSMTVLGTRDNAEVFNTVADNVAVIYDYIWYQNNTPTQANPSVTATISATSAPVYGYMDPAFGVTRNDRAGGLYWSNGYQNDTITVKVVRKNITATQAMVIGINPTSANDYDFTITWADNGQLSTQYRVNGTNQTIYLGFWPAYQLTLNGSTGDAIITPTTDLNLMSKVDITDNSTTLNGVFDTGDINRLVFRSAGQNMPTWQITNTTVFLDTYNTVMNDPSIDITQYFNYSSYRVNFYSFAIYGESMTVNNIPFTVNKINGTVTFNDGAGVERVAQLNNIYITREPVNGVNHTLITFVNSGAVYDLGATATNTISFGGLWYFTTGIYRGYDSTQTVYNWDLDGQFHANAGECLVLFLGILGAGVVVARAYGNVTIRFLDWIIIGFAVFGALIYFGGLI